VAKLIFCRDLEWRNMRFTTMTKHLIIGTTGIGSALARKLRSRGLDVHLISRNAERLAALAAELGATHAVADVTHLGQLEEAIAAAGNDLASLTYAVGSINLRPVGRLTDADVLADFELNALGAFRAVKAGLSALKASTSPTSAILLFSTVAVAQGFASHVSVAMAKGAVEGLTLSLAAELAPKVRVNCIAPSLTRTPLAAGFTSNQATAQAIAALHPMQRLGEADDVAALAALLVSAESSWITGQIIGVDGGRSALRTKG
jgi:NAD(P)-dependent dehydrogenase (short-subunit alcohol dehydrogenase family)